MKLFVCTVILKNLSPFVKKRYKWLFSIMFLCRFWEILFICKLLFGNHLFQWPWNESIIYIFNRLPWKNIVISLYFQFLFVVLFTKFWIKNKERNIVLGLVCSMQYYYHFIKKSTLERVIVVLRYLKSQRYRHLGFRCYY